MTSSRKFLPLVNFSIKVDLNWPLKSTSSPDSSFSFIRAIFICSFFVCWDFCANALIHIFIWQFEEMLMLISPQYKYSKVGQGKIDTFLRCKQVITGHQPDRWKWGQVHLRFPPPTCHQLRKVDPGWERDHGATGHAGTGCLITRLPGLMLPHVLAALAWEEKVLM